MRRTRRLALGTIGLASALAVACGSGRGGGEGGEGPGDGGLGEGGAPPGGDAGAPSDDGGGARDGAAATHPVTVDHACRAGVTLKVAVLEDAALRLHFVVDGRPQPERGWTFDLGGFAGPTQATVEDAPGALHVRTAALDLKVDGDACAITIASADGTVLWQDAAPFSADAGRVDIAKRLVDGERIFGLGEKTGAAARRGRSFTMWNSDPAWSDPTGKYQTTTDPIYQSHPMFVSLLPGGHATGAYLANTHRSTFDVGKTAPDRLAIDAIGGDVDLFVFDGPSPRAVLERYTRLVGRPFLPPLWTLGYHQSRWSYTPSQRVEDVAFAFRQKNLPADGMWLDIDYMDGFRDFTWNPTTFGDHAGMLARLAASGFKVTTIFDPGIKSDPGGQYAAYTDGLARGAFIRGADGAPIVRSCWPGGAVFPDFSDANVRAWWGDRLGGFMSAGTRGAWIDMNEPAVFVQDGFPLDAKVSGEGTGTTFEEIKNVYAWLMARASHEGQLRAFPNRRPFLLTRAGFAGIQRWSAVWTGDAQSTWDHLAMAPSMLQGMSASGLAFIGSDVGGFTGSPSPELYGRWFEVGSISPFFRSHVQTGAPDQEPWSFGPEVEDDARRMLAVRYALLPYWYDAMVEAHATGAPIVRPLWFELPADDEAAKHEDEVMIGGAILAAPVTAANVVQRQVYLPAGVFHDFYTGAVYVGPQTVTMPAPLGRFPLFVRGGSVLPEIDVQSYVGESPSAHRWLDVYPGAPGTQTTTSFVEDDGESMAYAQGQQSTTAIALGVTASGMTLKTSARAGGYVPPTYALGVRVHAVASAPSAAEIDGAPAPFAWDPATRVATIAYPDLAKDHALALTYDAATPAAPRQVSVTFAVTLPANGAGDVYVASSALGWQPNGQKLTRSGGTATGAITVLEGTLVKYKLTRGAWSNVEVDASCQAIPNRIVVAGGGGTNVPVTVAKWTDACP